MRKTLLRQEYVPHPKQNTVIQTGNDEQCMMGINNSCVQTQCWWNILFGSNSLVLLLYSYSIFFLLPKIYSFALSFTQLYVKTDEGCWYVPEWAERMPRKFTAATIVDRPFCIIERDGRDGRPSREIFCF